MIRPFCLHFVLFLLTLEILSGQGHVSDTFRVNEVFLNQPLVDVIKVFELKYKCLIAYEEEDITDVFVHRYLTNKNTEEALKDVLENSGLEYQFLTSREVLIRKNQSLKQEDILVLRGRIVSDDQQLPLPWATVMDSATGKVAYTDETGRFSLKLLAPSPSGILKIKYLGYEDDQAVWSTKEKDLFIKMTAAPYSLEEVIVLEKIPVLQSTKIHSGYRQKMNLNTIPLASPGMKDEMRALQLLPGITATNDRSAGLQIRGGDENESLYLLDGIEFFNIDHLFGIFSAFDANTIDSTSIYLSDFPIQYGGRTSGVVDMKLKNPAGKNINGQVGIHTLHSFVNLETKITKKSGILFSTRFTNGDISDESFYEALFNPMDNTPREVSEERQRLNEVVPSFRFNDSQLKWQYTPDDETSLSVTLFRGKDMSNTEYHLVYDGRFENLRSLFTEKYDESLVWDNSGANLSFDKVVTDKWKFEIDLSTNTYELKQNVNTSLKVENIRLKDSISLTNSIDNSIRGGSIRWMNVFTPYKHHEIKFGLDLENHQTNSQTTNQDTVLQSIGDTAYNVSIYSSYQLPLTSQLDFNLGIRLNRYSPTSSTYLSPRVALNYKPFQSWTFGISGGVYNQFLRSITYEDRFGKSHDVWLLANDKNTVLKSYHFNILARYAKRNFTLTAELYRKNSQNEIVQIWLLNGFSNSNTPSATNFRTFFGDGKYRGLNVYGEYRLDNYYSQVSYTLSENTISVPQIDRGAPFPASNDRRHELSAINAITIGDWTLANTIVYGSGYPYVSSLLVKDRDIRNLEVEERIERLPDYFRVDLAVNYNFKLWKQDFHAGLSIYNLLDRKNSDQVQYLYNLNNQSVGAEDYIVGSEINLLPRTVDVSLEWHF